MSMKQIHIGNIILNQGMPKIIAPFMPAQTSDIEEQAASFYTTSVDLIEWRADYFTGDIFEAMPLIRQALGKVPLLFTLRTEAQGGHYAGNAYAEICRKALLSSAFQMIDIEYGHERGGQLIAEAKANGVVAVLSWHDFHHIPSKQELEKIYSYALRHGADILKFAFMPASADDIDVVAELLDTLNIEIPLITIGMGECGRISRVIPEILRSSATFASVLGASAPGQIDVHTLKAQLNLSVEERLRSF